MVFRGDPDLLQRLPLQVSGAAIDKLRRYEKTIDVEDRIARARLARQRRGPQGAANQLKLRELELEHARSSLGEVSERLAAAERETKQLRLAEIEARSALSRSEQKAEDLASELDNAQKTATNLEQERSALRNVNADLEKDRAVLQEAKSNLEENIRHLRLDLSVSEQARAQLAAAEIEAREINAALREKLAVQIRDSGALANANAALREDLALLRAANAQLEDKSATAEQARASAEKEHWALAAKLGRASEEVAARQSSARDLSSRWDRELTHRKDMASALRLLASSLHSDIVGLLASRRWRIGRAIVASLYVLSLRRVPKDVGEQLTLVSERFRAKEQLLGEFATSRDDIPSKLAELAPTASTSVDELLDRPARRPAQMTVRLLERALELKRRAQHLGELSAHVDSLVTIAEGITGSWRWRLGNFVVSTLRRLRGGKVPATAADSIAALVDQYRSGSYADVARSLVIPMPSRPKEGTNADVARRDASSKAPTRPARDRRHATRPSLPATRVDIVVCVHNALEDVRRCLESVLSRTAMDFTLIVVNDGSDSETMNWLRDTAKRQSVIQLIETDGPLGYTRAANRGLRAATAPYVVLLNSDTIVPRLWVECLLECLHTDERLGIVGPLSNAASWQSVPERFDEGGGWAINDLPVGYNVDEYAELVHRVSETGVSACQVPQWLLFVDAARSRRGDWISRRGSLSARVRRGKRLLHPGSGGRLRAGNRRSLFRIPRQVEKFRRTGAGSFGRGWKESPLAQTWRKAD